MIALLVGRFHALTRTQATWLASLAREPAVERVVCVITSADHSGTRRNPLPVELREEILRPVLSGLQKPFELVRIADIGDDAAWPAHVAAAVARETGRPLAVDPSRTVVYTSNREVAALFINAGFGHAKHDADGLTPHELIGRIVERKPWRDHAAPSTLAVYEAHDIPDRLRAIFADRRLTDDGELAAHRDFQSYGAQMDAALQQKLDDLAPWVIPGVIVDKGCGTGRLLVELSRRFPDSAFAGVDLSRELLRRCDENTYASDDVTFIRGDAADVHLADGSASTIIFSSVMHEIYSYNRYDHSQIDRALASAARELRAGGRVLVRDGVSPGEGTWRLRLIDKNCREAFDRFATEFKRGQGAPHERLPDERVQLAAHLANEFLCKKDYRAHWDIEVHEEFGPLSLEGWRAAFSRAGLRTVELRGYVNPWIVEHRYRGTVELTDDRDVRLDWPATNFVGVAERA